MFQQQTNNQQVSKDNTWQSWTAFVTDFYYAVITVAFWWLCFLMLALIIIYGLNYYGGYQERQITLVQFHTWILACLTCLFNRFRFAQHFLAAIFAIVSLWTGLGAFFIRQRTRIEKRVININDLLTTERGLPAYELHVEKLKAELAILKIHKKQEWVSYVLTIIILMITVFGLILSIVTRSRDNKDRTKSVSTEGYIPVYSSYPSYYFFNPFSGAQSHCYYGYPRNYFVSESVDVNKQIEYKQRDLDQLLQNSHQYRGN